MFACVFGNVVQVSLGLVVLVLCATLVACVLNKRTQRTAQIELDGGILTIQWADNNRIYMTGPATKVFTATWAD